MGEDAVCVGTPGTLPPRAPTKPGEGTGGTGSSSDPTPRGRWDVMMSSCVETVLWMSVVLGRDLDFFRFLAWLQIYSLRKRNQMRV